jgi:hypothetical protein
MTESDNDNEKRVRATVETYFEWDQSSLPEDYTSEDIARMVYESMNIDVVRHGLTVEEMGED